MRVTAKIITITLAVTLAGIVGPLLLTSSLAQAQTTPPARIRLSNEDIQVNLDGTFADTQHVELQILTQAIIAQAQQQRITYDGMLEDIQIVDAFTVKPGGQKVAVDPSAVISQQAAAPTNTLAPIYTDQRQKVIVFPQVEVGDTLSFTYKRTQKAPFWPGQVMLPVNYLGNVAYDEARATFKVPKTLPLAIDANGVDVKKTDEGDQTVYSWSYSHPTPDPAAPAQPVNAPLSRPHVYLSSFKSYDDFGHSYAALVAGKIAVTPKIQAQADQLTAGITDKRAQARAIYEWVAERVRYVAINLGQGGIVPHDADWVLNNLYGDCKDHAVLFSSLLKAKGIAAELVMLNAGNIYEIPKVPEIASFNHMIVWLPDFKMYADTTSNADAFGTLPMVEYGKPVVHARASGAAQAQIPLAPRDMSVVYTYNGTVDETGRLTVTATTIATGPLASNLRRIATIIQTAGPDKVATDVLTKQGMPRATGTFTITPTNVLTPQYALTGTFKTGGFVANQFFWSTVNAMRVLGAPGDYLMGPLTGTQNNVKVADDAATPCYSGKETDDISLRMRPGMRMVSFPADASIRTSNLEYTTRWTHEGSNITLHREFVATMDQPICSGALRKDTAAALARIRADFETQLTLAGSAAPGSQASGSQASGTQASGPSAPMPSASGAAVTGATTVSFAADDTKVAPADAHSAGVSPTVQSALPTAPDAPHIDSLAMGPGSRDGLPSVVQQIFYHAPKGNAVTMHFEVISLSSPAPDFSASDIRIGAPAGRQESGTYVVVNSGCGRFPSPYSAVKRAVLIDADGKRSNAIDYSIKCNGLGGTTASAAQQ